MNRYHSYKNSGVKLIGEIPSSWKISKLKYLSQLYTGNSLNENQKIKYESNNLEDIPYISSKDINVTFLKVNYDNGLRIPQDDNQFKIAPKGSFLLCIEGGSAGKKKVFLERDVCFVNKLCCFKSNAETKYLFYFVQSINFQNIFKSSLNGLIQGVSISTLKNFDVPFPPSEQQTIICKYLDQQTFKINFLVEKIEKKIKLYKEKQNFIVNQYVAKGLNPGVKFKDTGFKWIGKVPSHWKVNRLKYVLTSREDKSSTGSEELLSITIHKGVVLRSDYLEKDKINQTRASSLIGYKIVKKGDLVNNIMKMSFRCLGTSSYDGIVSPAYSVFIVNSSKLNSAYLNEILRTDKYVIEYRKRSKGIQETRMRLYDDYFVDLPVLIPPISEQKKIVDKINQKKNEINLLIEKENKRVELLKEYRQTLVSEVVTGKINVAKEIVQ